MVLVLLLCFFVLFWYDVGIALAIALVLSWYDFVLGVDIDVGWFCYGFGTVLVSPWYWY